MGFGAGRHSGGRVEAQARGARERLATWMVTGKDAVVDDVNNLRWLRDRWRAAASAGCYRTLVIYLNIPHTELVARRRANQVTVERKGITEAAQLLQNV